MKYLLTLAVLLSSLAVTAGPVRVRFTAVQDQKAAGGLVRVRAVQDQKAAGGLVRARAVQDKKMTHLNNQNSKNSKISKNSLILK